MYFITKILLTALLLLLVEKIVPGVSIEGLYVAVIAAIVLGLLNAIVRPILVILTLPITIATLGLFIFVINAGLFMFAASFLEGFEVDSFWAALFASILVSVGSTIGNNLIRD
jgi:putative membrane protein